MNMVRHDAPCNEIVALPSSFDQHIPHGVADGLHAKPARSGSSVGVPFDAVMQLDDTAFVVVEISARCEFVAPSFHHARRHGVHQPKDDRLHETVSVEMRQRLWSGRHAIQKPTAEGIDPRS
jgi:hypothetical protein